MYRQIESSIYEELSEDGNYDRMSLFQPPHEQQYVDASFLPGSVRRNQSEQLQVSQQQATGREDATARVELGAKKKKKKVYYIARKVQPMRDPEDDQLGRPLSPIARESIEELDHSMLLSKKQLTRLGEDGAERSQPRRLEIQIADESEQQAHSIFRRELASSLSMPALELGGPRYDQNGQIVPYSIIGKANLLLDRKKIGALKKAEVRGVISRQPTRPLMQSPRSVSKFSSKVSKKSDGEQAQLVIKSKQDTLQELERIRERIRANIDDERKRLRALPYSYQVELRKQEHNLERFEHQVTQWTDTVLHLSSKTRREAVASQMVQSDQVRQRREATDIFDYKVDDFEKFGSQVWETNVRGKDGSEFRQIMLEDLPKKQITAYDVAKKKSVEIVRKPRLTNFQHHVQNHSGSQSASIIKQVFSPFQNPDLESYYQKRLAEVRVDVRNVLPVNHYEVEYDGLQLVGHSQFQREYESVARSSQNVILQKPPAPEELTLPDSALDDGELLASAFDSQKRIFGKIYAQKLENPSLKQQTRLYDSFK